MASPVERAFADFSFGTYAIADLTSSALANKHGPFFADKPSEVKGVFTHCPSHHPLRNQRCVAHNPLRGGTT